MLRCPSTAPTRSASPARPLEDEPTRLTAAPPRPSSRTTIRSHGPCWAQLSDGPGRLGVLGDVGEQLGGAEVADGLDGAGWAASGSTPSPSVGTELRAARVARAFSRPVSSAGGWMPRARSRRSVMASLAPR